MSSREYTVGLTGTFDVANYGDLMFPLLAQRELADRLGPVKVVAFSYGARSEPEWPFPVTSVAELPRLAGTLDALLVGGGYLVRFDKDVAPGYAPPTAQIHHPTGYWLTPALLALQHGVPLLWNAPGSNHDDLPAWAEPLLQLVFSQSSYIAVRDEPSRAAVARYAGAQQVQLVPDTVFGLMRWLPEHPTFDFNRLRDACGLTGPYIVIQGVRGLEGCYRFLQRHADRLRGYRFLALPIGPVNGDDDTRPDADLPGLVRLPVWPHPFVLAELIRQSAAVIGPSYHLAITALNSGVSVFTPADLNLGKFPGLAGFDGLYPLPADPASPGSSAADEDQDVDSFVARLQRAPVAPRVTAAAERVGAHWDQVAQVVRGGRTEGAVAIGRFWQSLPGLLEGHASQTAGAVAALAARGERAAERERSKSRIAELTRLVALARGEIAARDRRIAQFLASTSWKLTAPMRFVGKRLGR